MAFSVTVHRVFSAAHAIRLPDGSMEPLHGHDWNVRVTVSRPQLDPTGFVVDFHDLERQVEAIIRPMHNRNLNDLLVPDLNPTAENVCWFIAQSLRIPSDVRLASVEVTEAPGCTARYEP